MRRFPARTLAASQPMTTVCLDRLLLGIVVIMFMTIPSAPRVKGEIWPPAVRQLWVEPSSVVHVAANVAFPFTLAATQSAKGRTDPGCTDINSADSRALQAVHGVGASKARAIIDYRERSGQFADLDEVARVSGIGPAILDNIRRAGFCAPEASEPGRVARGPVSSSAAARPRPQAGGGGCKDINSASMESLQSLPGIGPSKASAIVDHIRLNGPFRSIGEVTAVRGIGQSTLSNIRQAGFCAGSGEGREDRGKTTAPPPSRQAGSEADAKGNCTDINVASAATLESVTGIGPSKARAILRHRDQNGPFRALDDLLDVSGIGPATLRNFREAGFCAQ